MSLRPIKFGTDGWRGRIAADYTFSAVRRCAQGFARYLQKMEGANRQVVVGHDKRFASEDFAAAAAEVLAANGLQVLLTDGAAPTPTISFAVTANGALGAVNITASHNPYSDNGFKVRDHRGGAVDPEGLREIEAAIPDREAEIKRLPLDDALEQGLVRYFDPTEAYVEQIKRLVDIEPIRRAGLKVVVDAMWGNGAGWFTRLLSGGATEVVEIHDRRNPIFPEMARPEPIPPNVDVGLRRTTEEGAQVLVVTDGDADRFGLGDEGGNFVDQLRVFGLLAYYFLEIRGERGPIVKTLSTTSMLNKLGNMYNVPVYETGVGFKYVAPKMVEVEAMIGGEESGGYAFRNHVPERDGILAGLYLLDFMVRTGRQPSELVTMLFESVGEHYYDRIDAPLDSESRAKYHQNMESADPPEVGGLKVTGVNKLDGYKYSLEDGGWLLIRFSGTEPLVRVYCETTQSDRVKAILQDGLRIVGIE
jgi:alpha-D-glucose phosphate-specific phosphoglucomutase